MRYYAFVLLAASTGLTLLLGLQSWIVSAQSQPGVSFVPGRVLLSQTVHSGTGLTSNGQIEPLETPSAAPTATVREELVVIPSHLYEAFLYDVYTPTLQTTFKKLAWNAYDRAPPVLLERRFTGIVLENPYLELTILPELGGRIYSCLFKPTGHNEFYVNPVLKPTHWGPVEQGWWLAAGGMEWCFPVEEHGYETGTIWESSTLQTSEGVTATVWNAGSTGPLSVKIDVHLPNDRAYFAVTPHLLNQASRSLDLKFWINAMLAPGGENDPSSALRFIFPTDRMTVHSRDKRWTALPGPGAELDWPILHGNDLSVLGNWPFYLGCFERPAAQNDFVGVYDELVAEGMVRVFPSSVVRGAKAFAFGYGENALKPDLWTDGTTSYVEVHGGLAPTFDECVTLPADDEFTWTEFWYPVMDIGGVVFANQEGALNLGIGADGVRIGIATTSRHRDALLAVRQRENNVTILEVSIPRIDPGNPYLAGPVPVAAAHPGDIAVTLTTADGRSILSYQPSQ